MSHPDRHKKFQAGVNNLIVQRSVVASRFKHKTALNNSFATKSTAHENEVQDSSKPKQPKANHTIQDGENGPTALFPIACPVPDEEISPSTSGNTKKVEASKKGRSFLSKIINLDL